MIHLLPIAFRNLRRNFRRTLLTALAVIIGVFIMIFTRGMLNGIQRRIVENLTDARSGHVQVHRKGYLDATESVPLDLNFETPLADKVRAVPGVAAAAARIAFAGMLNNGETSVMFLGQAQDPVEEARVTPMAREDVMVGSPLDAARADGVLVGQGLAQALKLKPGAPVTLVSNTIYGSVNAVDATVIGIVGSRLPMENKKLVIVPLGLAQQLLQMEGKATELALRAADPGEPTEALRDRVAAAVGDAYEVHTWQQVMSFFSTVMGFQDVIQALVTLILFVIVLTGIINTMLMTVFERVREVGTMMAIGLRRRKVIQLFLLESAALGLVGSIVGALLGFLAVAALGRRGVSLQLPGVDQIILIRPYSTPGLIAFAMTVAIGGALVSAAWPAWKASRLQPVEALRAT